MVFSSALVSFSLARVVLISYSDKANSLTLPYRLLALLMIHQKELVEIVQILLVYFVEIPLIGIGVIVTP
jgi:hypothetical protein